MATHTLVVLSVPLIVIRNINSILSSFLWGESNGRVKMKWCTWSKVCKPLDEKGVGVRDLNDV